MGAHNGLGSKSKLLLHTQVVFLLLGVCVLVGFVLPDYLKAESIADGGGKHSSIPESQATPIPMAINTVIPSVGTPTPTLVPPIAAAAGAMADSFWKAIGSIAGSACFVMILLAFPAFIKLWRNARPPRPDLRLQAIKISDGQHSEDASLLSAMQIGLSSLRRDIALLESRIAFQEDQLRYFGLYALLPSSVTAGEGLSVKLSVGPVEIGSLDRIWNWLTHRQEFLLLVTRQSNPAGPGLARLVSTLMLGDTVWYSNYFDASSEQVDNVIMDISYRVAWAVTQGSSREVKQLDWQTPPAVQILHGIHLLATYMEQPKGIKPLEEAAKYFRQAGQEGREWAFQAGMLEAITLQLTQAHPKETADQMAKLQELYGNNKQRRLVLYYNLGQAKFYTYERPSYVEAMEYFEKVQRPWGGLVWRIWLRVPLLRTEASEQQYRLYCLAQSNIAITKAHQVSPHSKTMEENQVLADEAQGIAQAIRGELAQNRHILGAAVRDIEWRLYNTDVMLALNLRENPELGIRAAQQALQLAPYALDIKANLGSLYLLVAAQQHAPSGADPLQLKEFKYASGVFENLLNTGWDPGFVKFRLGTIRRIQGSFQDALKLLEEAKQPDIIDVRPSLIDAQIAKANSQNLTLGLDDV